MINFKEKIFSKKEEDKKGKGGKIAAGVVGGTAATAGVGYAGLKVGKKHLEKQLKKQSEEFVNGIREQDKFIQENVSGIKNKVKNLVNSERRREVEEAGRQLSDKVTRSAANVSKLNEKIEKIDRVLDAPKKVIDKIKSVAKKKQPTAKAVSAQAKTTIVAKPKTRQLLNKLAENAAKVKGLIKK